VSPGRHSETLFLWHYTTGKNFISILRDRYIMPATAGVPRGEKPIVWFSANEYWEPTASKMLRAPDGSLKNLTMGETGMYGKGLVRIGVDRTTAPHGWDRLRKLSGMSRQISQGLLQAAARNGAKPQEWFGTFDPVPEELWIAVHYYKIDRWVPLPWKQQIHP
jgi:hypothetical protein